jgi:hypothetical protein
MMEGSHSIAGNKPLGKRINLKTELKRLRQNPIEPFLKRIGSDNVFSDEISRFHDAYDFYFLSLERHLRGASLAIRWGNTAYWAKRERRKLSPYEAKINKQYNQIAQFLHFDIANCLIHGRILMDRLAALSHLFLKESELPSFASFYDHKKFFVKRGDRPYGKHEAYAQYIRSNTAWFDHPLRDVRDKFVVHSTPKHMRLLSSSDYELHLFVYVAKGKPPKKLAEESEAIIVSIPRLADDIATFLKWFNEYAMAATETDTDASATKS